MTFIGDLTTALRAEFGGEVTFVPSVPPSVVPPAIVVAPGDPFITNDSFGHVAETWEVLVAVSVKDARSGISQMRELSLRTRKAASSVGAVWAQASGPRRLSADATQNTQTVVSVNELVFRYDPATYTEEA